MQAARDAATQAWSTRPCADVSADDFSAWVKELPARTRVRGMQLLFTATSEERILAVGVGDRIVAGDIYANPVWAVSSTTAGYAGGVLTGLAVDAGQALVKIAGTKGGADSITGQLKEVLGKNQRIWVTDTHLVFVTFIGTRFAGEPVVRASVPLADVTGVK